MQKVPIKRHIPIPVKPKDDGSYTHIVQIGEPVDISDSESDSLDSMSTTDEEGYTTLIRKPKAVKNAFINTSEASWIHGGLNQERPEEQTYLFRNAKGLD